MIETPKIRFWKNIDRFHSAKPGGKEKAITPVLISVGFSI
jgi:hypothetical protein